MKTFKQHYEEIFEGKFAEIDLELNEIVKYLVGLMDKNLVKTKKDLNQKLKELRGGQLGTTWSKEARTKRVDELQTRLADAMNKAKITLK